MKAFSNTRNILGEGPIWVQETQSLWWVDIHDKKIYHQHWGSEKATIFNCPARPSALGQIDNTTFIVAFEDGIYSWSPKENKRSLIALLPERHENRTNDGKIGPNGCFWFGTMDDNETIDSGGLYSLNAAGNLQQHKTNIGISNTFAWSPNGDIFYFADSKAQQIYRTSMTGRSIGTMETFVDLRGTDIYPDGSCVDINGCLWNAQWDGARIVQYAPDGQVLQTIDLPVQRPTSCCFGGPEHKHLFITTASVGLNSEERSKQPLAGKVLIIETNTTGTKSHSWR